MAEDCDFSSQIDGTSLQDLPTPRIRVMTAWACHPNVLNYLLEWRLDFGAAESCRVPDCRRGTPRRSQKTGNLSCMVWRALDRANNSAFHTKGTTVNSSVLSKEKCGIRDFLDSGKALDE